METAHAAGPRSEVASASGTYLISGCQMVQAGSHRPAAEGQTHHNRWSWACAEAHRCWCWMTESCPLRASRCHHHHNHPWPSHFRHSRRGCLAYLAVQRRSSRAASCPSQKVLAQWCSSSTGYWGRLGFAISSSCRRIYPPAQSHTTGTPQTRHNHLVSQSAPAARPHLLLLEYSSHFRLSRCLCARWASLATDF
jgi:hypothetical protein